MIERSCLDLEMAFFSTLTLMAAVVCSRALASIVINCTRGHHSSNIDVSTIDPDGFAQDHIFSTVGQLSLVEAF